MTEETSVEHEMMIRLDERVRGLNTNVDRLAKDMAEQRKENAAALSLLENHLTAAMSRFEERYVTQAEFVPIKAGFYGLVGVIVLAVIGALIATVIPRTG